MVCTWCSEAQAIQVKNEKKRKKNQDYRSPKELSLSSLPVPSSLCIQVLASEVAFCAILKCFSYENSQEGYDLSETFCKSLPDVFVSKCISDLKDVRSTY